jgi:hypothetical protein
MPDCRTDPSWQEHENAGSDDEKRHPGAFTDEEREDRVMRNRIQALIDNDLSSIVIARMNEVIEIQEFVLQVRQLSVHSSPVVLGQYTD